MADTKESFLISSDWMRFVPSLVTMQKGQEYFADGNVEDLIIENADSKRRITAHVKSYSNYRGYNVNIDVNPKGQVTAFHCNCMASYNYSGMCKHVIATILTACQYQEDNSNQKAPADPSIVSDMLLKKYENAVSRQLKENKDGNGETAFVTFTPILEGSSDDKSLRFMIRRISDAERDNKKPEMLLAKDCPRAYVMRSTTAFLNALINHEKMTFGKDLSFIVCPEAFDETGKKWLNFIKLYSGASNRLYNYDPSAIDLYSETYHYIFENLTDALFALDKDRTCFRPLFHADEYRFKLHLGKKRTGEAELSFAKKISAFSYRGDNSVFISEGGELWCFPSDTFDIVSPLLDALEQADGHLRIPEEKKQDFFTHVIPEIAPYCIIDDPRHLMDGCAPETPVGKIVLDAPDCSTVTAVLYACYHGLWLDPVTGKAVARSVEADDSQGIEVDWTPPETDTDNIRRDTHAEQRFFVSVCHVLGYNNKDILAFLEAKKAAGSAQQPFTITNDEAIFQLLSKNIGALQALGDVIVTDRLRRMDVKVPKKMSVGVSLNGGLLEFHIDSGNVPMDELRALLLNYRLKRRYFRMKNGGFVNLSDMDKDFSQQLEELEKTQQGLQLTDKEMAAGKATVPAFRALYLDGLFHDYTALAGKKDNAFDRLCKKIREYKNAEYKVPAALSSVLRPYQKTGYLWMCALASCGFGGILADEMGLGKSVQLLAFLLSHDETAEKRLPSIIVSPSSLVLNWRNEVQKFTPQLHARVVQGTAAERKKEIERIADGEIVLTSYDSLKRDIDAYHDKTFYLCAIDEAQYIKNHDTQAAKTVKQVVCEQRFALTGTPIENRLSELWSIFDFLMPNYLYNHTRFTAEFEQKIVKDNDTTARENLRRIVMPFVLRRLKQDVLTELPPKITSVFPVKADKKQQELYDATLLTGLQALKGDEKRPDGVEKIQVLALLTRLRRLCCDPTLVVDNYKGSSAKADACMDLLQQAHEDSHRVLLFSQYTDMLDILEARIKKEGFSFLRLQGSTPVKSRLSMVDEFNKGQTDVFLISLKAGGTGLNLTAADTVIHYDPWWNQAAQDQATDRAHRIGQKNTVQVYKLIMQNTIEEKILKLQEMKKDLASVVETENNEQGLLSMSADEIIKMLESR